MQQQLTHELKYKSNQALLIIGTSPSGPSDNEDQVQRVICDWAFKGLLTAEMQVYFDALPLGITTICERNKFGRSHTLMVKREHLMNALSALKHGQLIPTEYK